MKLIKLAITVEIGINSRGKTPCLNIEELTIKELEASVNVLEKNIHGMIAERTRSV